MGSLLDTGPIFAEHNSLVFLVRSMQIQIQYIRACISVRCDVIYFRPVKKIKA